jgi:hypothetical protein
MQTKVESMAGEDKETGLDVEACGVVVVVMVLEGEFRCVCVCVCVCARRRRTNSGFELIVGARS